MPTLVHDPAPGAFVQLLEERRRLGLDGRDEVRGGVLHMIPPPSVGHEKLAHRLHVLLENLEIRVAGHLYGQGVDDVAAWLARDHPSEFIRAWRKASRSLA